MAIAIWESEKMIMKWLLEESKGTNVNSIAKHCRRKRMAVFEAFLKNLEHDNIINCRGGILDVGGELDFWESTEFEYLDKIPITLLNLRKTEIPEIYHNVFSEVGDATDLRQYANQQFDFVFSNSVIEHVGNFEKQRKMAQEMKRVGRHCYLQTPNRYFPLEPHFLVPFFQFFPTKLKIFLLRHFSLGSYKKIEKYEEALQIAESIRLLTKRELESLFPGIQIRRERVLGLTKSFYLFF